MKEVTKPWGSYTNLLDEEYTKVKKIVINPGESPRSINIILKEMKFGLL